MLISKKESEKLKSSMQKAFEKRIIELEGKLQKTKTEVFELRTRLDEVYFIVRKGT